MPPDSGPPIWFSRDAQHVDGLAFPYNFDVNKKGAQHPLRRKYNGEAK
jgi:hypothetical protein